MSERPAAVSFGMITIAAFPVFFRALLELVRQQGFLVPGMYFLPHDLPFFGQGRRGGGGECACCRAWPQSLDYTPPHASLQCWDEARQIFTDRE